MTEFNSTKGYREIQKEIKAFLKEFGFKPYKSSFAYRVTEGDILQFINFQKGYSWLNEQMTINVVIQGLFTPGSSMNILEPGGRIGKFIKSREDTWWYCDTPEATSTSIVQLKEVFTNEIIPFFENTNSSNGVVKIMDYNQYEFLWQCDVSYIYKGFFNLAAGRYAEALNSFNEGRTSRIPKFKTIKKMIENKSFDEISLLLDANSEHVRKKIGI